MSKTAKPSRPSGRATPRPRRRSVWRKSPWQIKLDFLRAVFERKQRLSLWGRKSYHTPWVVDKCFGDGQQLIYLTTINGRPNYYVVCVDSSWRVADGIHEKIDLIEDYISETCGYTDSHDDDGEPLPFPALDAGGSMWGVIPWSEVLETAYQFHLIEIAPLNAAQKEH